MVEDNCCRSVDLDSRPLNVLNLSFSACRLGRQMLRAVVVDLAASQVLERAEPFLLEEFLLWVSQAVGCPWRLSPTKLGRRDLIGRNEYRLFGYLATKSRQRRRSASFSAPQFRVHIIPA